MVKRYKAVAWVMRDEYDFSFDASMSSKSKVKEFYTEWQEMVIAYLGETKRLKEAENDEE